MILENINRNEETFSGGGYVKKKKKKLSICYSLNTFVNIVFNFKLQTAIPKDL